MPLAISAALLFDCTTRLHPNRVAATEFPFKSVVMIGDPQYAAAAAKLFRSISAVVHPLRRSTSSSTQAGLFVNDSPSDTPSASNCSSFNPSIKTSIDGSDDPSLIRFGTTTLIIAMLPYGSPIVKFGSNAPFRVPCVTTSNQPVAVISAPG